MGDIEVWVHFTPGNFRAGGKGWGGQCVLFGCGDGFLLGQCIDNGRGHRVGVIFLLVCSVLGGPLYWWGKDGSVAPFWGWLSMIDTWAIARGNRVNLGWWNIVKTRFVLD